MNRYLALYPSELRGGSEPVSEYRRWRGIDLHVARVPDPRAEVTVIALHGGGGHGDLVLPFARLADGGPARVEVVVPDLPGYGRSGGNPDHATWIDCVTDLVAAERARAARPVVVIGASMGGLIGYGAAARGGVDRLVATCLIDPRDPDVRRAISRHSVLAAVAPTLLTAAYPLTDPIRVPIRWLARMDAMSHDPHLVRLVCSDPRGGGNRVPLRFLRTFLSAAPEVEPERFTACPVVLAHPGADTWTPAELSARFVRRIAAPTRIELLDRAGHLPVEQPGLDQLRDVLHDVLSTL